MTSRRRPCQLTWDRDSGWDLVEAHLAAGAFLLDIVGGAQFVKFPEALVFVIPQVGAVIIFFPGLFTHGEAEVAAGLGDADEFAKGLGSDMTAGESPYTDDRVLGGVFNVQGTGQITLVQCLVNALFPGFVQHVL